MINIMVNKAKSKGNLKNLDIFKVRSNQMMNWGKKLGKLVCLEIRLQDKPTESKITQFGLVFAQKWSKNKREK